MILSWFGKLSETSPFSFHQLALHLNETSLKRISASGLGCSSWRHQLKPLSCQILTWLIFFTLFKRDITKGVADLRFFFQTIIIFPRALTQNSFRAAHTHENQREWELKPELSH